MDLIKFQNQHLGTRTEGNHNVSVVFKEFRETPEDLLKEANISKILGQHG